MTTHRRPSASSQGWTQSTEEKTPVCVSVLTAFVPQQAVKSQIEPNEWKQTLKKEKKGKGELFCLPICLSICARRRVKTSNLDFTWLGGLRSAVGWRMFVSSGSRRAVWSLKSVRSSIKKKNSSLWCFGGQCSQTAAVCGWVTTSYNTAGTCYCLYSCRCSVWYTLNLNCRCWMCSGVKYVVCWSSLVSLPTLFIQSPDFSSWINCLKGHYVN